MAAKKPVRPAVSMAEEIAAAKKLGASDSQARAFAKARMSDPNAVPKVTKTATKAAPKKPSTSKMKPVPSRGRGSGLGGLNINNLKK